jgi:hypothetical protein
MSIFGHCDDYKSRTAFISVHGFCYRKEKPVMRKVIVGAMVSMDGVMQAPGGPEENPTRGFKFGG